MNAVVLLSPGLPAGAAANSKDITIAAGQNPIPVVSVYRMYPQKVNSSERPTGDVKSA